MVNKYQYSALLEFSSLLGERVGLPSVRAQTQAEILLEADLMGHSTHGLALLPNYLKELEARTADATGEPIVVNDRGSSALWDGNRIIGTWLVTSAVTEGIGRVAQYGVVTYVIRGSGHVAALISYLRRITDHGLIGILMTTNPAMRTVVPAGGIDPVLAPNPIALGCPTEDDPILIDISTSAVANGWVRRWASEGKTLPEKWLQDFEGNPTDDPKALFGPPPGAMLPLGGLELGHKGFALGLLVEILTGGLSGIGHTRKPEDVGNLVYLQIIDPECFTGKSALKHDASMLSRLCRSSRPRPGHSGVRMPGDRASALRRRQLENGIELYPAILPGLQAWAEKLGIPIPLPMS